MNILRKLLWRKSHRLSSLVAGFGLAFGMWILLLSLQGFIDFKSIAGREESAILTINKSVGLLNTLGMKNSFQNDEIQELEALPGIKKVASFQANDFKVSIRSTRLNFYTELFFESLPDDFLEDLNEDFNWNPESSVVPIVLPKQYISLYNFGFAPSQGLPQVSPDLIQRFTFDIEIRGSSSNGAFKGKIVDLTDKANTVLVPESFLSWANKKYGSGESKNASRIAVLSQADQIPAVKRSIEDAGYEISSNELIGEKAGLMVQFALLFILIIGMMFLMLAGFLVYQSLKSLISESNLEIKRLFEFGKSPQVLIDYFQGITLITTLIGLCSGAGLFLISNYILKNWINHKGIELSLFPHWAILVLILIIGVIFYAFVKNGTRTQLQSNFP